MLRAGVIVGIVGVLTSATVTVGSAAGNSAKAEGTVQLMVRAAMEDIMDAATFKVQDWRSGALDVEVVNAMHEALDDALASHFTGEGLAFYSDELHAAIERESDGQHVVVTAGGVDEVRFSSVDLNDASAQASGRVHDWITWEILEPQKNEPSSGRPAEWDNFAASLVATDDGWRVANLSMTPIGDDESGADASQ